MVKRSDKVAFIKTGDAAGGEKCVRMTNFTEFSTSKNAKEYTRQYVDEDFERSDVVGYSPSISYSFDLDSENEAHKVLAGIADDEKLGADAVVTIVVVDMEKYGSASPTAKNAWCREFTVIPDSEGNSTDAYTYSGTLKANGTKEDGYATPASSGTTGTKYDKVITFDLTL